MSTAYLKVKIKSLAVEARIIRHEERKAKRCARWLRKHNQPGIDDAYLLYDGLRAHRRWDVRREARATQLAYGMMRDRTYRQLEPKVVNPVDGLQWQRVVDMIAKYGPTPNKKDVERAVMLWKNGETIRASDLPEHHATGIVARICDRLLGRLAAGTS